MVLAFSLQSDIKSVGAYAGFAAIIGLALLVLLYFAHAREIRRTLDWLEQHEERLRSLPAGSPMPRPALTPPGRVVTPPASPPSAQPAAGATNATVAVPGVRRVSVGAIGAVPAGAPAGPAGVVTAESAARTTIEPGAVAAATVAGAMAAGPAAAPADAAGEATGTAAAGSEFVPGRAADDAAAESFGPPNGEPASAPTGGEVTPDASAETPAQSAAVPLSAPAAATAEPVGAAQAFEAPLGADVPAGGSPPDTAETAIVSPFGPESPVEISAERIRDPAFDFAAGSQAPPVEADAAEPAPAETEEPPPLGPSTPAGARPRFPPAPELRAAPVGATARVSGQAAAATLGADAAATTRRRGRDRPPPQDGDAEWSEDHPGGSTLRLIVAAVVIVAVLIFVATKVLDSGSNTPTHTSSTPSGSASTVGPSPSSITVAVLNGTHSSGLATRVSSVLGGLGFGKGPVRNALSQGHTRTLVGYVTSADRAAALEVASDLKPTLTRVGPLDAATAALVEATGATPNVVVTLGSNYAGK
jgi:hypothetical protein